MNDPLQLPFRRQSFTPRPPKSQKINNHRKNRYLKQSNTNKLQTFETQEVSRNEQLYVLYMLQLYK